MTDNGTVNAVLGVIGLALLLKGSGWMIDGAAAAAMRMRINETIVGLTLVSVGTSLPELATNVYAAIGGNTGVAVGNVGGSNITNVLLVLGVAAVMAKRIETDRDLYRRDSMVMLLAYIALCLVCYAGLGGRTVMRAEGALLLVIGFVYVAMLIRSGRADEADDDVEKMAAAKAALLIVAGVIMVPLGARLMVDSVVWTAARFSVPDTVVSAVVIALGTSLPELAVTGAAVMRNQAGMAVGNVVGSNIFNIVLVMGTTAMVSPVVLDAAALNVVLPFMVGSGLLMVVQLRTGWDLTRKEGIVMLSCYAAFLACNFYLAIKK